MLARLKYRRVFLTWSYVTNRTTSAAQDKAAKACTPLVKWHVSPCSLPARQALNRPIELFSNPHASPQRMAALYALRPALPYVNLRRTAMMTAAPPMVTSCTKSKRAFMIRRLKRDVLTNTTKTSHSMARRHRRQPQRY